MLSDGRCLYVGRLVSSPAPGKDLREEVRSTFAEFGSIQMVRCFPDRGFAFVTYVHRGCAEFAYAAMMDQPMGASEVLNIRWAEDDPNPQAKAKRQASGDRQLGDAMDQRIAELRGEQAQAGGQDSANKRARTTAAGAQLSYGSAAAMVYPQLTQQPGYQYPDTSGQFGAGGAGPRLPEGWEQAVDPASGHQYYYNMKTGERQWTHPTAEGNTPNAEHRGKGGWWRSSRCGRPWGGRKGRKRKGRERRRWEDSSRRTPGPGAAAAEEEGEDKG